MDNQNKLDQELIKKTRKNLKILLTNPTIKVSWIKADAGNIGTERADQLAKDATQHGQPNSLTKPPKPHIKGFLVAHHRATLRPSRRR
ncbi:hypothetical protein AVEN_56472-1 [Araneus ventricosus]|uniref:RNase H type-1 domain-containing protein n=1 Tax=Araneus ventricosus TaxID=182803 RepID=A0A4Y2TC53_ARAVE|nr:hypothetical protein AVEN_56472-1 [Araneus ventricosus]